MVGSYRGWKDKLRRLRCSGANIWIEIKHHKRIQTARTKDKKNCEIPWTFLCFNESWISKLLSKQFYFRRYDEDAKAAWQCGSWCEYIFVVVFSSILLLASIVLTVFWIIYYKGGYSLDTTDNEQKKLLFNFHPTLMVAGYITLSGFCKSFRHVPIDGVKLIEIKFLPSHTSLPHLSLLLPPDCQVIARIFPRLLHSVHRDRLFGCLGVEKPERCDSLLLVTLLARSHHQRAFRFPIRIRIL